LRALVTEFEIFIGKMDREEEISYGEAEI
jgi:hypothetical protein